MDWLTLQARWDAQQESYLPDREQRFAAMLDVLEALGHTAPRVLDLAGGTGSISLRVFERFPEATSVLVDVDDALLRIAAGTFSDDGRIRIVRIDLATPRWVADLDEPAASFDAVLTATALHWLPPRRVAEVYGEAGGLLHHGGVLANADHMPDPGLTGLDEAVAALSEARSTRARVLTGAADWDGWWAELRADPEMAPAVAARDAHFADRGGSAHTESYEPSAWHVDALRAGGFGSAGLIWRGLADAVVLGVRS
jgi:SAM-dependent methyltransferase